MTTHKSIKAAIEWCMSNATVLGDLSRQQQQQQQQSSKDSDIISEMSCLVLQVNDDGSMPNKYGNNLILNDQMQYRIRVCSSRNILSVHQLVHMYDAYRPTADWDWAKASKSRQQEAIADYRKWLGDDVLAHSCDVKNCIRPTHLSRATRSANLESRGCPGLVFSSSARVLVRACRHAPPLCTRVSLSTADHIAVSDAAEAAQIESLAASMSTHRQRVAEAQRRLRDRKKRIAKRSREEAKDGDGEAATATSEKKKKRKQK